jgi:hypothetical protein
MKACETGYKKLMLTIHSIAPPDELLVGEVAFADGNIAPPHEKRRRYLKKREKLKATLWNGEKKDKDKDKVAAVDDGISSSLRQLLSPSRSAPSRKDIVNFL